MKYCGCKRIAESFKNYTFLFKNGFTESVQAVSYKAAKSVIYIKYGNIEYTSYQITLNKIQVLSANNITGVDKMKRYLVSVLQNKNVVDTLGVYSSTNFGACKKALKTIRNDYPNSKGFTAIAKHSDFYGNEIPEEIKNYNYSIPYNG